MGNTRRFRALSALRAVGGTRLAQWGLGLLALALAAALYPMSAAAASAAADRIVLPPERREVQSPSGQFVLVLGTADRWKTPYGARAEVYRLDPTGRSLVWRRDLPHYHGPRRALVTDQGEVLLADEWINVVSRFAIVVIAPDNQLRATYTAREVFAKLGVPPREISARAKAGPWISEGPVLSDDGHSALFVAGGRRLDVNLSDGSITIRD